MRRAAILLAFLAAGCCAPPSYRDSDDAVNAAEVRYLPPNPYSPPECYTYVNGCEFGVERPDPLHPHR